MNRGILVSIILIVSLAFPISPANAATEGCPDTWKIDTSKYPNNPDLLNAQNTLGKDMVLTVLETRFISGDGETGSIPKLNWLVPPQGSNFLSMSYLYGKSILSTSIKVEVRSCPKSQVFEFTYRYSGSSPFTFIESSSSQFAQANPSIFIDFKKQESFPLAYRTYVENLKTVVKNKSSQRNVTPILIYSPFAGDFGLDVVRFSNRLFLVPLNQNCVIQPRIPPDTLELIQGGKCEFAVGIAVGINPLNKEREVTLLEHFTLDSTRPQLLSITCIKGKLTKKVTALKPKCPSGYKVKK
jgi:hypothetical protein